METKDIRIEYDHHTIKAYAGDILLWDEKDTETPLIYNGYTPEKLDTSYTTIHYNDYNTTELYVSYAKILTMIERMDNQVHQGKRSKVYHDRWTMDDLRSYCQGWLDDVRFRNDCTRPRWWPWDRLKYILKGHLKDRMRWLRCFGTICCDMSMRLDAIDGGNVEQPEEPVQTPMRHIGF